MQARDGSAQDGTLDAVADSRVLVRPFLKFALCATVAFGAGYSAWEAGLMGTRAEPEPGPIVTHIARHVAHRPADEAVAVTVRPNDTLDAIFRRLKLSLEDLAVLRTLPGVVPSPLTSFSWEDVEAIEVGAGCWLGNWLVG